MNQIDERSIEWPTFVTVYFWTKKVKRSRRYVAMDTRIKIERDYKVHLLKDERHESARSLELAGWVRKGTISNAKSKGRSPPGKFEEVWNVVRTSYDSSFLLKCDRPQGWRHLFKVISTFRIVADIYDIVQQIKRISYKSQFLDWRFLIWQSVFLFFTKHVLRFTLCMDRRK